MKRSVASTKENTARRCACSACSDAVQRRHTGEKDGDADCAWRAEMRTCASYKRERVRISLHDMHSAYSEAVSAAWYDDAK